MVLQVFSEDKKDVAVVSLDNLPSSLSSVSNVSVIETDELMIITLSNPSQLNIMNEKTMAEIAHAFYAIDTTKTQAVVLGRRRTCV